MKIELYSFAYVHHFVLILLYYAAKLFNTKSLILLIGLLQVLVTFGQQVLSNKKQSFLFDNTGLLSNPGEWGIP